MSRFRELLVEDQRLVILRWLEEQTDYALNDSVIQTGLDSYGHRISRDQVRGHLAWLEEQGLLTTEDVGRNCLVATLTGRGGDVATGRITHPGVKRPRPGE